MNKDKLSQIRNNISKRKDQKKKYTKIASSQVKTDKWRVAQHLPDDEARHGHFSSIPTYNTTSKDRVPFVQKFLWQSVAASAIFFAAVFFQGASHTSLEEPKKWTNYALTEEFPFATVNAWYQSKFGAPFAIESDMASTDSSPLISLPVYGEVTETFQENGDGVLISTDEKTEVTAVDTGTVIFAGKDNEKGNTVIVQHADQSKTIYGHLTKIDVYVYQSIQKNQKIGEYEPEDTQQAMFFSIEKNRQAIDPIQVIEVGKQK
ncbi:stage IV sporulation protein FA [Gracilibacillus halotolerans]|uniref:Stage IV sporulation protein FA n=1 Tax=Gracilibacillus halotolerans TaxID=74386 RepID=A0A841RLY2_9BACI|nr:M23 family metallopeptidase [Gracilibacillus halotolerans]MBB6511944.1 stage IV sporulation protein FA [Gracilibacillus halotolerans]